MKVSKAETLRIHATPASVFKTGLSQKLELSEEDEKLQENFEGKDKFQKLACSVEFGLFTFWVSVGNLVTLFCIFTWSQFAEGADPLHYRQVLCLASFV